MSDNNNNYSEGWSKHVNWDLPDAEIARRVGVTRERVRQVRKEEKRGRAKLFRVRLKSLQREEKLRQYWRPDITINEVAELLETSYSNAYRLLKEYGLSFVDGRRKGELV